MDRVREIADAVLYEGYILWPYRRSAIKNRQRWTFGGVYPREHSEGREDDPWTLRTECLLEAVPEDSVSVEVRFLQVVERQVWQATPGGLEAVDELEVGGERHLTWDEATERELATEELAVGDLTGGSRLEVAIEGGSDREEVREPGGRPAGAVIRSWQALAGEVEIAATKLANGARRSDGDGNSPVAALWRLAVTIRNTTPFAGSREEAIRRTLCSTHTILRAAGGGFVSLTDPPAELRSAAEACRNEGTWPVLVGEAGDRHTVLSSPIILEDYPRVAPESPGDLFDGSEIDQLLVLNILSLTGEEKAEMRDSDPRAREILERTESLTPQELMRLHGTIREFAQVRR